MYAAEFLCDKGNEVCAFGFGEESERLSCMGVKIAESPTKCAAVSDAVILPIPYTLGGGKINMPYGAREVSVTDVCSAVKKGAVIFAGRADEAINEECRKRGIILVDYSVRPEFEILNALPTAEGAVMTAMQNVDITLGGSRCLVVGYGRIGKLLSAKLKALDAVTAATARKESDIAAIKANGLSAYNTADIADIADAFDIIFNTVPYCVIDRSVLQRSRKDVLIIDLASRPGGVDFKAAEQLERKVICATALPGKTAPKAAGGIIADTVVGIFEEYY